MKYRSYAIVRRRLTSASEGATVPPSLRRFNMRVTTGTLGVLLLVSGFTTGALLLMLVAGATEAIGKEEAPPCGSGTSGRRFVLFDGGTTVCDNLSGGHWERTPLATPRTFAGAAQAYCAAKGPGWQLPDIK